MTTGEKIRFFRILHGLTQQQLALLINKFQKNIVDYEKNIINPPEELIDIFKNLLKINPKWLLYSQLPILTQELIATSFEVNREVKKEFTLIEKIFDKYIVDIEIYKHGEFDYFVLNCPENQKIVVRSASFYEILNKLSVKKEFYTEKFTDKYEKYINYLNFEKNSIKSLEREKIIISIAMQIKKHNISIFEIQNVLDKNFKKDLKWRYL